VKELHLNYLGRSLKFKTECSDKILNEIEEYINAKYSEHKLEQRSVSSLEVSNLLLVNAVYEILSLKKDKEKDNERISSIISKLS
jgi:hypothetical protein